MGNKAAKAAASRKRLFEPSPDEPNEKTRVEQSMLERNALIKEQNGINAEANNIQLFSLHQDELSAEYIRLLKIKKLKELKESLGIEW